MPFQNFDFSIFITKNGYISRLVSSYRVSASFKTSTFSEYNTEYEQLEKSRVLQKCPLTHITLTIIILTTFIMIKIIVIWLKKYDSECVK